MSDVPSLLLGEWACLGMLAVEPQHGFALAAHFGPSGDVGRVWSMSRPLTYRALDKLVQREFAEQVAVEPGRAGGPRSVMAPTAAGRHALDRWLASPVAHLRHLRSELLVKLVLLEALGLPTASLLSAQRQLVVDAASALERSAGSDGADAVAIWRAESAAGALRVIDRLLAVSA
jgi:PadR family transcriptional regulator AphA